MVYNDKITESRLAAIVGRTLATGPDEGGSKLTDDLYAIVQKLNMEKAVTLTCGGSGTSTAITFAALGLPDMLDDDFLVIGLAEANVVSLKATTGFTFAHSTDATAEIDVKIVGNWAE